MPTPHVFFGQLQEGLLGELDADTFDDLGVAYNLLGKTNPFAPGGAGGEAIFPVLYLTVKRYAACSLYITPLVDGLPLETTQLDLTDPGAEPMVSAHEIALSVPYVEGMTERLRLFPRGTWFQVRIYTDFDDGDGVRVDVEAVEVEHEIVQESKQSEGTLL